MVPTVLPTLRRPRTERARGAPQEPPSAGRLGLNVPHEWWPAPALLKSFDASGFTWVQVDAPPSAILARPEHRRLHAAALRRALAGTDLAPIVHAPRDLRLGSGPGDEAFAGLLRYAIDVGAAQVVYHALALVDEPHSEEPLRREGASLAEHAELAERLGIVIAIENLAPPYPGADPVAASPLSLRGLALRTGSDAVGICLDIGHAHVVAELRHTTLARLVEPVADLVTLFHLHDNLGARRLGAADGAIAIDPLRLDLHLAPGTGTLPLADAAELIREREAPVVLEVHPPHRPAPAELFELAVVELADAY
jgi:sugar phosphate isomerase/epimerase